jgi:hypothetical protein
MNASPAGGAISEADSDHRKGVSFLSRFIGTKKKLPLEGSENNDSETGDHRVEGMDATLFTHNVDNLAFNPKQPQPPAYIKVRTRFKKETEFNRLFLSQELRFGAQKGAPAAGANPVPQSGSAGSQNPVWATEWSKDGKYLAAGGQDRVVRIWTVISTPEERQAHELEESHKQAGGDESTHLSAPVFRQKPFREYLGHQGTILDLSWSKVSTFLPKVVGGTCR